VIDKLSPELLRNFLCPVGRAGIEDKYLISEIAAFKSIWKVILFVKSRDEKRNIS
jgi:hypothetical protein